jgi:hypothetical protein
LTAAFTERLLPRKESKVADAGQAAVFLKVNVLVAPFIGFLEIQHNKTRNHQSIPELFLIFILLSAQCKNLLLVI